MIDKILKNRKTLLTIIVLGLLAFVVYASIPFIGAIFGATILAYLFSPLNNYFKNKLFFSKSLSAWLTLIISFIFIIIPCLFLFYGIVQQVLMLPEYTKQFGELVQKLDLLIPFKITINEGQVTNQIVSILTGSALNFFTNLANLFFLLFLLFFLFYYLLYYNEKINEEIYTILPFDKERKVDIIKKFREVTYSSAIGTGIIALVQGGLLAINFYLFGIPNALFWGFVAAVFSFLPVVGPPLIWIPTSIIFFLQGDISKGFMMLFVGIIISASENIIRPVISKKYGKIHPIVSIFGVYMGIAKFGIVGILLGPLIISYLLLFWNIYKEEYLKNKLNKSS